MQSSPVRDLLVGLFLLGGLLAVAYLSVQVGGLAYTGPGGLQLVARFDNIGGLAERAPVVISGVKVGQVTEIDLDESLRARVTMEVDQSIELDVDTRAQIRTAGLLGDQYVALQPGAASELLESGQEIVYTDGALVLEALIERLVAGMGTGESGS